MQDNKKEESVTSYDFDLNADMMDVLSLISSGGKWFYVFSGQDRKLSISITGGELPEDRWWIKKSERQNERGISY